MQMGFKRLLDDIFEDSRVSKKICFREDPIQHEIIEEEEEEYQEQEYLFLKDFILMEEESGSDLFEEERPDKEYGFKEQESLSQEQEHLFEVEEEETQFFDYAADHLQHEINEEGAEEFQEQEYLFLKDLILMEDESGSDQEESLSQEQEDLFVEEEQNKVFGYAGNPLQHEINEEEAEKYQEQEYLFVELEDPLLLEEGSGFYLEERPDHLQHEINKEGAEEYQEQEYLFVELEDPLLLEEGSGFYLEERPYQECELKEKQSISQEQEDLFVEDYFQMEDKVGSDQEETPDQEYDFKEKLYLSLGGEEFSFQFIDSPTTQLKRDIIKFDDYLFMKNLGVGGFGSVKLFKNIAIGELVACKVISSNNYKPEEVDILREVSSLPGVIRLHDVYEDSDKIYLVMDYCPNGDLSDYMEKATDLPSESDLAIRFKGLMESLSYCHSMGVVHRDIKPDNILLDESMNFVLADFGLATRISDGDLLQGFCGTHHFIAPEILDEEFYTEKVDIWSAGILLSCLLTRETFKGDSSDDRANIIKNEEINFDDLRWMNVSLNAIDLVSRMLNQNQHERPSAKEVLKHPWFETVSNIGERKPPSSISNAINSIRGCGTGPDLMGEGQQRFCYAV